MDIKCYKYDDFSVYITPIFENNSQNKREKERLTEQFLLNYIYNDYVILEHNHEGKPYLKYKNNFISISHSKHNLCIAISNREQIGIDVEEHSNRLEQVMTKFLTADDIKFLPKQQSQRLKILTLCWSQKEAVYKLIGKEAGLLGENIRLDIKTITENYKYIIKGTKCEFRAFVKNKTIQNIVVDINDEYEIVVCRYINK